MHVTRYVRTLAAVALISVTNFAGAVHAQRQTAQSSPSAARVAEARRLFDQGMRLVEDERWGEAVPFFEQSAAIVERPATLFNLASAFYRLGRYQETVRALESFMRVADPARDADRIQEAQRMSRELAQTAATVVLRVSPSDAVVRLDDTVVAGQRDGGTVTFSADPGTHRVVVEAEGYAAQRVEIAVTAAERLEREVTLGALPARIAVVCEVRGAQIRLDGREVSPGESVEVAAGSHEITATAEEREPFRRRVTVGPGELARVVAVLPDIQDPTVFERPIFWVAAGGVVIAATTAILLYTYFHGKLDPLRNYNGTTGQAVDALVRW